MKTFFSSLVMMLLFTGCYHAHEKSEAILSSIQILDRNGITETISTKDRLKKYESVNFSSPQPFHQVLRMYYSSSAGLSHSVLTSYHPNGYLHQYIEIVDGRAHGLYRKFYDNGKIEVEAKVIEGTPTFSPSDQEDWLFDGISRSYAKEGHLVCELPYDKGFLEGEGIFYFSSGAILKRIPFHNNLIEGTAIVNFSDGTCAMVETYSLGKKQGLTKSYGKNKQLFSWEEYTEGKLISAKYYDAHNNLIASVDKGFGNQVIWENGLLKEFREIQDGDAEGLFREFTAQGKLFHSYFLIGGQKKGEEIFYDIQKGNPKMSVSWKNDQIHGKVKTWYRDGTIESQKEYSQNKKQGLFCVWYPNGKVMLHEEYENDRLQNGSYYSRDFEEPVSCVIQGSGVATIYDQEGIFLNKVHYINGQPEDE